MIGEAFGLQEIEAPLALRAHGFDGLEALKHLDARLRLTCFACLVAEALNVGREVRCRRFERPACGILLAKLFNPFALKLTVVSGIAADGAVFDRPDGFNGAVEEFTVVRNNDDGRFDAPQPVFEPDEGVDVEVVGRFVEKKQIRRPHEGARERDAVSPAARKVPDHAAAVGFMEPEARQNGLRLGDYRPFVYFREFAVRGSKRHFVA